MTQLRRFFREHLKAHAPTIALASVLLLLAGFCQGALIASVKFVFDDGRARVLPVAQHGLFAQLEALRAWAFAHLPEASALRTHGLVVPLVLLTIFTLKGLFAYSGTLLMVRSGIQATQSLRERLFAHLVRQELAFFQKHPVGELITRSISDVNAVQGIASNQLAEAVREICVALTMLFTVLYMDWQLSLTVFLAGPLVVYPIRFLSRRIRSVNHRNQEASSRLLQRLKEVFGNIRVVQAFARESYEVGRFQERNQELYRLGMKSARASALSTPIMEFVGGLLLAGLAAYASGRFKAGTLTTENFLTFILGIYALYDPLRRLTKLNNEIQVATASLDRVYSMLDRQPALPESPAPQPVPARPEVLRFEDVALAYDPERSPAQGLRHLLGGDRQQPQRRPASAHRHRPGPAAGPAHPDPGRGHQRLGHRERAGGAERPGSPHAEPHHPGHRPPPEHHPAGHPHLRPASRPRGGRGHPRGPAGAERRVRAASPPAVHGRVTRPR